MRVIVVAAALIVAAPALVFAKLPELSDDAKAKAAEATAKTAHGERVAAYKLCQSMERVAARYIADAKKAGKDVTPAATAPCADPGPFVFAPPAATPAAAPATAAATAPAAAPPATAPAAAADAAPKPIEAAGAHSPPETATKPPNTTAPAAVTNPTPNK